MLFSFEQLDLSGLTDRRLDESLYTINGQIADYAIFTLEGGDIRVRYDGKNGAAAGFKLLRGGPYKLLNQEMITGFVASDAANDPVLNIMYVSLEWTKLRRLTIPRMKFGSLRRVKTGTQEVHLQTGGSVRRRTWSRPLHEFEIQNLNLDDESERDLYGLFTYHQGDRAAYYYLSRYSSIDKPVIVGYGDGLKEDFFLPGRFIVPGTLKVYFNRIEVDSYGFNHAAGLVSFHTAPPLDVIITASYTRYYKCVFEGDFQDSLMENPREIHERQFILKEIHP